MRFPRSPMAWIQSCQPLASRLAGDLGQAFRRRDEQARLPLLVGVVGQQRRAAAPERAVRVGLDRAHREEIRTCADAGAPGQKPRQRVRLGRNRRIDADGKLSRRRQTLEGGDRGGVVTGGILDFGQAGAGTGIGAREEPPVEVVGGRRGHRPADEIHGIVDENPGRRSIAPAQDAAAVRIFRRRIDSRRPERRRVDPEGMAVHAPGDGRAARKHVVERSRVGKLAARPEILVPASPFDPRSGGRLFADSLIRRAAARASGRPRRSAMERAFPTPSRCRCESAQPGKTNLPERSTVRAAPAIARARAGSPTKRTLPPSTRIETRAGRASADV